jgi:DNA-binding transcriptional MerR regulator
LYYTGEFAQKASVSIRTLRYYDRVGLLSPSHYTEAGYRLYSDDDLLTLQQILALKFLGFSLKEIKACLCSGPMRLHEVLAMQKAMMRERRMQLDSIIQAIDETEQVLREHTFDCAEENWQAIVKVIQAIQMEQNEDWVNKYFTPEQRQMMKELSEKSYSPEAAQKLAGRVWTEEDQRVADQQWSAVQTAVRQLAAQGADPASQEAQAVVEQVQALLSQFTQGDAEICAGLKRWWNNYSELPAEQKPFPEFYSKEEQAFLEKAQQVYKQRNG